MKKKKVIITVCVALCIVLVALVRVFTPYLGRPFLIYCHGYTNYYGNKGSKEKFYLSGDLKKIDLFSSRESCVKFVRYCSDLEELTVYGYPYTFNIKDISNPNLKKLDMSGYGVNWSSLNNCTELKDLCISFSDFYTTEDISKLIKMETLSILVNKTELSLNKLNELQNLRKLELNCKSDIDWVEPLQLKNLNELDIYCANDIDCENLSNLENLETLSLKTDGKITGLDKMDNVVEMYISSDQVTEDEICGMDSLKEITIHITKLSEKVESTLREKGVTIKYID
ncbi:MAG: hypothetical protein K6F71_00945 [Ruminococcus sp.]|uniref:hypothetical protein n=1 Tax=Ruminococcus sp. TaxID=41978 RepID=UPI0025CE51A0|nr:hypothetical protein [Ruminococcus sp.]MCR5539392.1 hypothetical protein [Ruminococcus sp.]